VDNTSVQVFNSNNQILNNKKTQDFESSFATITSSKMEKNRISAVLEAIAVFGELTQEMTEFVK